MTDSGIRKATIHDVAALAGVSIKSVSRVMNREPNVTPALAEKVTAAIRALDYVPNPGARRMGNARSFVIALFYHTRMGGYIDRLQVGAARRCRASDYILAIEPFDWDQRDVAAAIGATVRSLHLDGAILVPPISDDAETIALLTERAVPFVRISPRHDLAAAPRVHVDDRTAVRDITAYVLSLGHRDIAFVGGPDHLGSSAPRRAGFEDAVATAGLTMRGDWMENGLATLAGGQEAAERLLSRPDRPSAIVTGGDVMALGAMFAAGRLGLRVPEDLSLVGFDDTPQAAALRPGLTTIRQPVEALGEAAADIIIGSYQRPPARAPQDRLLPTELVIRGSCAPPATARQGDRP